MLYVTYPLPSLRKCAAFSHGFPKGNALWQGCGGSAPMVLPPSHKTAIDTPSVKVYNPLTAGGAFLAEMRKSAKPFEPVG